MTTTHELKCYAPLFDAIERGDKTFDIREDTDRHFQTGDTIVLTRTETLEPAPPFAQPAPYVQPHQLTKRITFVLHGERWGLKPGFVCLSLDGAV